jgi:hypothetical protein
MSQRLLPCACVHSTAQTHGAKLMGSGQPFKRILLFSYSVSELVGYGPLKRFQNRLLFLKNYVGHCPSS